LRQPTGLLNNSNIQNIILQVIIEDIKVDFVKYDYNLIDIVNEMNKYNESIIGNN
jgi:hypothetical protein